MHVHNILYLSVQEEFQETYSSCLVPCKTTTDCFCDSRSVSNNKHSKRLYVV